MTNDVFLDTSFTIALASAQDEYHPAACNLAGRLDATGARIVTTRAVLLEIGNYFAKRHLRAEGVVVLESLSQDDRVQIVEVDSSLYQAAFRLFRDYEDKEWSLTDCISFTVMHERRMSEALTADHHFQQAGFIALLLETLSS